MKYKYQFTPVDPVLYCLLCSHPRKECNLRAWYVDMLADGHLTDTFTGEQLAAKSELDGMLKQAKLNKNDMVSCKILDKYSNIFKVQDGESISKNTNIENEALSSQEEDTKVNMDVTDETEFGDETDFSSDDDTGVDKDTDDGNSLNKDSKYIEDGRGLDKDSKGNEDSRGLNKDSKDIEDGRGLDKDSKDTEDDKGLNKDSKDTEDGRDLDKDSKDTEDGRGLDKDSKDTEDGKGLDKDSKDTEDGKGLDKDSKDIEDGRGLDKDSKDIEDGRGLDKGSKDIEDGRGLDKDSKDIEDGRGLAKDSKDIEDGRGLAQDSKDIEDGRGLDKDSKDTENGTGLNKDSKHTEDGTGLDKDSKDIDGAIVLQKYSNVMEGDTPLKDKEEKEQINIDMNKKGSTKVNKVVKKTRKRKPRRAKSYISSLAWGICFRDHSPLLQHIFEPKEADSGHIFAEREQNILQERRVLHSIHNITNKIVCKLRRRCSNYCYYLTVIQQRKCLPEYDSSDLSQTNRVDGRKTSKESTDSGISNKDDAVRVAGDSETNKVDVKSNTESLYERESGHTNQNVQNTPNPTFDFLKFEQQLTLKAGEYESKIQSLEIMIMRLENRLLSEKLSQQNDTGSFARLENHILKVENELLKLNQSYFLLREENEMLKKRQGKYLELAHVKSQSSDNSNTTKQNEIISKQQLTIIQLQNLLQNHSEIFDKLKRKHIFLEEQNQILHQIVMNQTALISNIMKKMQEIADDNHKQRQETQSLRAKMDVQTTSSDILEKLEHFVSDKIVTSKQVDRPNEEEEKQNNIPKTKIFYPEIPGAWFGDKTKWQCRGNKSPRYCFLYSIILSPCPPFSPIYWNKCPFLLKRMPVDESPSQNQNSEPNLDDVRDVVRIKQQSTEADDKMTQQDAQRAQSTIAADHAEPVNSLETEDGAKRANSRPVENDQKLKKKNEDDVTKDKKPDEKVKVRAPEEHTSKKDTTIKKTDVKIDKETVASSDEKTSHKTPEIKKVAEKPEQIDKTKPAQVKRESKKQKKDDSVGQQKVKVVEKPRTILYPPDNFDKAKGINISINFTL